MSSFNLPKQGFIFSTQILLNISVFELNNRFDFRQRVTSDVQSILEFWQLIHDFLACGNSINRLSLHTFPVASVIDALQWPVVSTFCSSPSTRVRKADWIPVQTRSLWALMQSTNPIAYSMLSNVFGVLTIIIFPEAWFYSNNQV